MEKAGSEGEKVQAYRHGSWSGSEVLRIDRVKIEQDARTRRSFDLPRGETSKLDKRDKTSHEEDPGAHPACLREADFESGKKVSSTPRTRNGPRIPRGELRLASLLTDLACEPPPFCVRRGVAVARRHAVGGSGRGRGGSGMMAGGPTCKSVIHARRKLSRVLVTRGEYPGPGRALLPRPLSPGFCQNIKKG